MTVDEVMASVVGVSVPGALNIYDEEESVRWGDPPGQATWRRRALRRYLASHWSAPTVLVGEAPGKNGARHTGLPFTSMRQMTGTGPAESTATTVQRVLAEIGQQDGCCCGTLRSCSPRTTAIHVGRRSTLCAGVLALICRGRRALAIGRCAQTATGAPYIRHPSHGGSSLFADGLRALLSAEGLRSFPSPARAGGTWPNGGDVVSTQPVGTLDGSMRTLTRRPQVRSSHPDRNASARG